NYFSKDMIGFDSHSGIYAIPAFVLLKWYMDDDISYPQSVEIELKKVYEEYKELWDIHKKGFYNALQTFQSNETKVNEDKIYETEIIKYLGELKYVFIGGYELFKENISPTFEYKKGVLDYLNMVTREIINKKSEIKQNK